MKNEIKNCNDKKFIFDNVRLNLWELKNNKTYANQSNS